MALPWQLLWGLRVNRREKIALLGIFSLGLITMAYCIARGIMISPTYTNPDPVWANFWSNLELAAGRHLLLPHVKFNLVADTSLAITVVNLPLLKSLVTRSVRRGSSRSPGNSKSGSQSTPINASTSSSSSKRDNSADLVALRGLRHSTPSTLAPSTLSKKSEDSVDKALDVDIEESQISLTGEHVSLTLRVDSC